MTGPIFVIPQPPEGTKWLSVDLGVDITTSPGGKEFVDQIKKQDIVVIVQPEGGMSAYWYPTPVLDANAETQHRNGEGAPS